MKTTALTNHTIVFIFFFASVFFWAQVGINTTTPDASAILDIESTNKGMLTPRMTTAERDAIINPAEALLIYNTDNNAFQYHTAGSWLELGTVVDCAFFVFPDVFNENIDLGETITRTINFNYTQGNVGNISTSLVFASPGFNIVVDNIANNNINEPDSQDITFTLDASGSATVGDSGQAIFQIESDCGLVRFVSFNINVTGCDFEVIPETEEVYVTIPAGGFEQVTVDYLVNQTGNIPGNVTLNFSNLPEINAESVINSPCAYTCNTSFTFRIPDSATAGTYNYTLDFVSDCGFTVQKNLTVLVEDLPRNCKQIKQENGSALSGEYTIDVDGLGSLSPMQAYCDMDTDNGGWTLILNYYHAANTNPAEQPRSTSLPVFNPTSTLGDDQSNTIYWGHTTNTLLNLFDFTEVRFYGETSSDTNKKLHFKHNQAQMINYFKTGAGGVDLVDLRNNFTPLTNHNALLPFNANRRETNRGNNAMLSAPFRQNGVAEWRISIGNDWEMDDNPNNDINSTIHQIWIR